MLADLALVGFGNVGRRFVRLLEERRDQLGRDHDLTCHITGIATRRHGTTYCAAGIDAAYAAGLLERGGSLDDLSPAVNSRHPKDGIGVIEALARSTAPLRVVVETTTLDVDAGQPAIRHVRLALGAGCHVVTANKGPAAFAYRDLSMLARSHGCSFLFEGAVMDGVPVFNLVRETLPGVTIRGFRGVVNSTTNHILSALEEGLEFAPALARMQSEGIAEADPSLDVDGWDAAAKTAALANVLLDARVTPLDVERTGIGPETASRARAATADGRRLRLVASAARGVRPGVRLEELSPGDLLASLRGTANALILDTDTLGNIAICQLDGGLTHTAYALLSDLITIRRGVRS
jgi:homoserine dehydrogenase